MTEPVPAPSSPGSVILDLGPGTGALVLHTPPGLDGQEIEISPSGGDPGRPHPLAGPGTPHQRRRQLRSRLPRPGRG
jgi:hypothetical protein